MYNNTFATIAGQDGDAYIVKVDKQPNTMKVPASAIKKPSYNEGAAEGDDSVLPLLKKFISKKSDPADRQDLIKVYRAFQPGMPQGFETLSNQWGTNLDAEFYHFAKQQGVDLNSIAKKHGVLKDSVAESKKSKPDFLDMDKDGDKKEPMKKAVKDKNDAKRSFQKQMGGSARDLTKGLSIGAKSVSENKHDLPFDVDPKEKAAKKVTPGKHGQEYSQVRHLARKGMSSDAKKSSKQDKISESDIEESALQAYLGKKKYGSEGMKALQQAGRDGAGKEKMAKIRASHDKMDEADEELNEGLSPKIKKIINAYRKLYPKIAYDANGDDLMEPEEAHDETCSRLGVDPSDMDEYFELEDEELAEAGMDEGNKFAHNVIKAKAAGIKKADLDGDGDMETVREMFPGTPEYELRFGKDDASSAFDKKKISTGTVYSRRYQDEPEADDDTPRTAGRPKGSKRRLGAKGPGVNSKLLKGKGGLKEQDIDPADRGEYDREGDMALNQIHQIADAVEELHSILDADANLPEWVQSKITKALDYIDTARDYLDAKGDQAHKMIPEKAVSRAQQQAAGAALAAKRGGGKAIGASKEMAKMSTKELEKFASTKHKGLPKKVGKVEEESTDTRDDRADRAGRRVAKDIEYDEKKKDGIHGQRRGAEDSKAEKAGKKVAKDIEHDEKVDETTVAGSVATSAAPAKSKGGMQFGKGVYEGAIAESFDKKLGSILNEGMNLTVSTDDQGQRNISVSATGADADSLGNMLKMAGLFSSEGYSRTCEHCHGIHEAGACQAEQVDEELANAPNEQYSDTDTMVNTLSGGLNGPKLQVNPNNMGDNPLAMRNLGKAPSGQVNLGDMVESVGKESTTRLWDLYKGYKAK
jgi:hypothetical protein